MPNLYLVGFLIALIVSVLLMKNDEAIHREQYFCVSKAELVKKGFAVWNPEKRLIIVPKMLEYYGFSKEAE